MEGAVKTENLRIGGMTCVNCQNRIEKALGNAGGVLRAEVDYNTGAAAVSYDAEIITLQEIRSIIEKLDYSVLAANEGKGSVPLARGLGFLGIIAALFLLIRSLGFGAIFSAFPLAETGMGYGMLFVIGLVSSVHCVAMCGGINLSQCLPGGSSAGGAAIRPSLLYNLGRILSYTTVGIVVGALGRAISFSGAMKGIVQIVAGVFMAIMGIAMLGIFPGLRRLTPRMPRLFARRIEEEKARSNSALYVGLLTGIMPCGPLQAMQLYALSAGSPAAGGLSMLIFSLGTTPLMFGFGALSSLLSKKFTRAVMSAGAVLVAALGLVMFSNGWALSGFSSPVNLLRPPRYTSRYATASPGKTADNGMAIENGVQLVNTTLLPGRYQPIVVMAGIPVRWTIDAPPGSINGCNNRMIIREYGIERRFAEGANVIEFTPEKPGVYRYSCWMGMIRSNITVLENDADRAAFNAVPATEDPYPDDDAYFEKEFGDMAEWDEEDMEDFWNLFEAEFPDAE
jgi:sulfite exporter TauE/SafE/copper chaperone CopZ